MSAKIAVLFILLATVYYCCGKAIPDEPVKSDANIAIDKLFDDFTKGLQQLAKDGVNIQGVFQNISTKANEFGEQLQNLGKELGEKIQESAKQQGLTN